MAGLWKSSGRYSANHTYKEKRMRKVILAVLGAMVFGKLFPVILLALMLVGLGVIIKAAVEEGKQL